MKKSLFLIGTIVLGLNVAYSQTPTIANGSFESWSSPSGSLELQAPTNWSGSDKIINDMALLLTLGGYDVTPQKQVFKIDGSMATDGGSLVELHTKDLGSDLGFIPGIIANGDIEVNAAALMSYMSSEEGDITSIFDISNATAIYGRRVDSVKVDATCWGPAGLQGTMVVNAMKNIDGENTLIGSGMVTIDNTTTMESSLQEYTAYINYTSEMGSLVDTMIIFFMSSSMNSEEPELDGDENYVRIDNVRLYTSIPSTGVENMPKKDHGVSVYPIPASDQITFNNQLNNNHLVINIYSITGQIMHQAPLSAGENNINLSQYAQGNYTYEIIDTEHRTRQTGQFIK